VVGGFSQGFAVCLVTVLGSEQELRENRGCSRAVGVLTQGREDLGGEEGGHEGVPSSRDQRLAGSSEDVSRNKCKG
jgi:hypothetical protein